MCPWAISRVRNWGVRVCEILLISFFRSAWTLEGEQNNNSKLTDPNPLNSEYGHKPQRLDKSNGQYQGERKT